MHETGTVDPHRPLVLVGVVCPPPTIAAGLPEERVADAPMCVRVCILCAWVSVLAAPVWNISLWMGV
jgi:hypothetical protein